VFELDQLPRDPEWIPEWMATKAAAYHKEREAGASEGWDFGAVWSSGRLGAWDLPWWC